VEELLTDLMYQTSNWELEGEIPACPTCSLSLSFDGADAHASVNVCMLQVFLLGEVGLIYNLACVGSLHSAGNKCNTRDKQG